MNVLVIRKVTNFELHGARTTLQVDRGHLHPENLSKLKQAHDDHYQSLEKVQQGLVNAGIKWNEINRGDVFPSEHFDYVITVGGDGTLLTASHQVRGDTKLIGVKSSFSSVGFLCSYSGDSISSLVSDLSESKLEFAEFTRLGASITSSNDSKVFRTDPVLNDILFANKNPAATTRYKIALGEKFEIQKSSGIWVSTPVGSSAAILAAGGTLENPLTGNCQFKVRELYRAADTDLKLSGQPFDPDRNQLMIENRNESAILATDGQHGVMDLRFGDRILIENSEPIHLVKDFRSRAIS